MRVNLAFKILRQKVCKSPRQYFATKVRKLRFQILKTEVCKSRHQAHRTQRVHFGKNISVDNIFNDKHGSLKACWPKRELREAWTG